MRLIGFVHGEYDGCVDDVVLRDGNKRLGWLATVVFLDLHGHASDIEDDEAFDLVMSVAQGELDVDQIAARLHRR